MIKKLIVNADDFGLSEGVCLGILKAHRDGILTSTTCMMNMENIEKYLEMTKAYPNLGLVMKKEISNQEILIKIEKRLYYKRNCIKNGKPKLKSSSKLQGINQPI